MPDPSTSHAPVLLKTSAQPALSSKSVQGAAGLFAVAAIPDAWEEALAGALTPLGLAPYVPVALTVIKLGLLAYSIYGRWSAVKSLSIFGKTAKCPTTVGRVA